MTFKKMFSKMININIKRNINGMDILGEMTKKEIIDWLRSRTGFIINPPKRSELLFIRWQNKSKEAATRRRENSKILEGIDGKKQDEYAREFNNTEDLTQKLIIAKKMQPYTDQFKKYAIGANALRIFEKKVDKIYEQIDIERKKENKN